MSSTETLDMPIYINKEYIVSVYEQPTQGGSLRTCIHGAGHTWHVEESLEQVVKMINEDSE